MIDVECDIEVIDGDMIVMILCDVFVFVELFLIFEIWLIFVIVIVIDIGIGELFVLIGVIEYFVELVKQFVFVFGGCSVVIVEFVISEFQLLIMIVVCQGEFVVFEVGGEQFELFGVQCCVWQDWVLVWFLYIFMLYYVCEWLWEKLQNVQWQLLVGQVFSCFYVFLIDVVVMIVSSCLSVFDFFSCGLLLVLNLICIGVDCVSLLSMVIVVLLIGMLLWESSMFCMVLWNFLIVMMFLFDVGLRLIDFSYVFERVFVFFFRSSVFMSCWISWSFLGVG